MLIATLLRFTGPPGSKNRSAAVALPSGEVCVILLSRRGDRIRKAIIGRFGRSLYREVSNTKTTVMALSLRERFPHSFLPPGFVDFNFGAFANAVLHCRSCAEVKTLFRRSSSSDGEWPPLPWTVPGWIAPTD
jgi:hypothetical protein